MQYVLYSIHIANEYSALVADNDFDIYLMYCTHGPLLYLTYTVLEYCTSYKSTRSHTHTKT